MTDEEWRRKVDALLTAQVGKTEDVLRKLFDDARVEKEVDKTVTGFRR